MSDGSTTNATHSALRNTDILRIILDGLDPYLHEQKSDHAKECALLQRGWLESATYGAL